MTAEELVDDLVAYARMSAFPDSRVLSEKKAEIVRLLGAEKTPAAIPAFYAESPNRALGVPRNRKALASMGRNEDGSPR